MLITLKNSEAKSSSEVNHSKSSSVDSRSDFFTVKDLKILIGF